MKTGYTVHDCMTTKPVSIKAHESIQKAALLMHENHVGSLLVEGEEHPAGVITEQDIVRQFVAKGINPVEKKIFDFKPPKNLVTIKPEADIYEAILLMRDHNIRHLPVIDDSKELVGLLTIKDVLKFEPQLFEVVVEKFEVMEEERKLRAMREFSEPAIRF